MLSSHGRMVLVIYQFFFVIFIFFAAFHATSTTWRKSAKKDAKESKEDTATNERWTDEFQFKGFETFVA